ncbi:helix-turn-helix domain-containing protein [Natronorubrum daqingense]|uniref:DNA-binding protein n=1 Tax=Natronorubrum daqingense TaxID=588898 RepID=A0A1N7CM83_9EURY|nr:helix-turn-helix domain-containing protein [Natronorubrum daqingense]APX96966.1 DNA-binding protein [Natronorubrum daqingense]SIR64680.1 Predicted DNA binding protein, contains HTH domain [Natronorubrum daqingense]
MRYVTYVLTPQQGYFDPGEQVLSEYGVTLRTIQDTDFLSDGTIVTRREIVGDREDVTRALEHPSSNVFEYMLSDVNESKILQMHYQPSELTTNLLEIHQRHAVLLDYPMEYTGPNNAHLRVSQIGSESELRSLISETRALTDLDIERLGRYDPSDGQPLIDLTNRQREVLSVAIEEGYYQEPREVTYQEIADELGCSAGTVGQHLRRIESQLMSTIVLGGTSRTDHGTPSTPDRSAETKPSR